MIYIIKQFLNLSLIFILFSCSIITNSTNTAEYFLNSFIKDDLVNEEVYQNYEYSFISVKNTSFNHAYLILKEYENDVAIWVDGDGNEITTNNYRVSSTQGLRRNMALKMSEYSFEEGEHTGYYNFYNPDASNLFFRSVVTDTGQDDINYMGKKVKTTKLEEEITIFGTNTTFRNTYWINKNNDVLKSIQKYHPFSNPLKITFYYKYE